MFETKCNYCGKEIKISNYRAQHFKKHYCSRICSTNGNRKPNNIKIFKDYAQIIITSRKYGEHITYIDLDDVGKINNFRWGLHYDITSNKFYVWGRSFNKKRIALHRYLMNCPKEKVIDHLDCDTLNNRKSNLRICTHLLNAQNREGAYKTNKSCGIRNVTWNKRQKKWIVTINKNKRKIQIGVFDSILDAEKAAIEARKKYFEFNNPQTDIRKFVPLDT